MMLTPTKGTDSRGVRPRARECVVSPSRVVSNPPAYSYKPRPFHRRDQREPEHRINERIRAREVRVIVAATGAQLGVMRTDEAIAKAKSYGLDLVEVAANAQPPVCRIVDYGKYRYEQAKQEKERKHAVTKVKKSSSARTSTSMTT